MALRATQMVRHAPRMMLAVANPALSGQQSAGSVLARAFAGCRGGGPVDPQLLRSLVALPDTGQEVRDAAAAIGAVDATLLMGEGASETALRKASPGDYRILYFATHGLIPGELQCQNEPGLVLTPPAAPVAQEAADGLLAAGEIVSMDLRADLVVLSACNTATPGGGRTGTGALAGLADAFFRAGARSVLASHWQVPSAATGAMVSGSITSRPSSAW
jgi:CHAT domain-containing protein